jgi:beta-N-acetylhexosaminidase
MYRNLVRVLMITVLACSTQVYASKSISKDEDPMQTNLAPRQLLSHKLADKIIIGFQGTSLQDPGVQDICQKLKHHQVGGVILFAYNIVSPEQTKQLILDLKTAAGRKIWIAVDQEGGKVQRLRASNGFTDYKSPYTVAHSMTPEEAYGHYHKMALELADIGFNLNFGCVLDLHALKEGDPAVCPIIGGLQRSYGSDPAQITAYATAFVKAHRDAGVTSCLKHYPGHGLAGQDSHAGLVDVTKTHLEGERVPFRMMIKAGMADMIMSAHLVDRNVDAKDPISLSEVVLHKWLRDEDGFKGLVITDDLHMGAIGDHYKLETAVLKALKAGSDIIIISNNKNAAPKAEHFEYLNDLPAFYEKVAAEEQSE